LDGAKWLIEFRQLPILSVAEDSECWRYRGSNQGVLNLDVREHGVFVDESENQQKVTDVV